MKKLLLVGWVFVLVLSACGDDGDDTATDDETTTTTTTTTDTATTTAGPEPDSTAVTVEMREFVMDGAAAYPAGSLEITAANLGDFSHEFNVVAGTYAELPQEASGAVIEDDLDLLVELEPLDPGQSETVVVDLEPGQYVFFCNITIGPNSHAGAGQTLDVTVS